VADLVVFAIFAVRIVVSFVIMYLEVDPVGVLVVKGRIPFLAVKVIDLSALIVVARMLFRMITLVCDLVGVGRCSMAGVAVVLVTNGVVCLLCVLLVMVYRIICCGGWSQTTAFRATPRLYS
jgi:hypothetical protein